MCVCMCMCVCSLKLYTYMYVYIRMYNYIVCVYNIHNLYVHPVVQSFNVLIGATCTYLKCVEFVNTFYCNPIRHRGGGERVAVIAYEPHIVSIPTTLLPTTYGIIIVYAHCIYMYMYMFR